MLVNIAWMKKNYEKYNNLYWEGKLPNISFKISRSKNTWGYAEYRYNLRENSVTPLSITLSNYYDSEECVKLTTLLHEMIHIADYTFNPQHFVRNHKKVTGHTYDSHGYWFKAEAKRLEKFGWEIEKYVTAEEKSLSSLTKESAAKEAKKINDSLVCVVTGNNHYNWMIKTSVQNISYVLSSISKIGWKKELDGLKKIKVYTFTDKKLAMCRSQKNRLCGWKYSHIDMLHKLENIKATQIHDYDKAISRIIANAA